MSPVGLGVVLIQRGLKGKQIVSYASITKNLSDQAKEALGLVSRMISFILYGRPFLLFVNRS